MQLLLQLQVAVKHGSRREREQIMEKKKPERHSKAHRVKVFDEFSSLQNLNQLL